MASCLKTSERIRLSRWTKKCKVQRWRALDYFVVMVVAESMEYGVISGEIEQCQDRIPPLPRGLPTQANSTLLTFIQKNKKIARP